MSSKKSRVEQLEVASPIIRRNTSRKRKNVEASKSSPTTTAVDEEPAKDTTTTTNDNSTASKDKDLTKRQKMTSEKSTRNKVVEQSSDDEKEEIISSDAKRKRRETKKQTKTPPPSSENAEDDKDDDSSYESDKVLPKRRRKASNKTAESVVDEKEEEEVATKSKKRKAAAATAGRGRGNFLCPHCEKVFTSDLGLKYHINKKVCQRDKDQPMRRRGKAKGGNFSGPNKNRGRNGDRTCPNCRRVFTSVLGCQYHIKHKVCSHSDTKATAAPFCTLQPGEKFVTMFGIVQVVKDDRNTPTAEVKNLKDKMKLYQTAKQKAKDQKMRHFVRNVTPLRARRIRINAAYEKGNVNRSSIFGAYYGHDPTVSDYKGEPYVLVQNSVQNPSAPVDSFPDRMVECIWLPNRHPSSSEQTNEEELLDQPSNGNEASALLDQTPKQQRLFLKRRLLTEPYVEESDYLACEDCGRKFASEAGYKYHTKAKSCITKNTNAAEARKAQQEKIDSATESMVATKSSSMTRARRGGQPGKKKKRKKKKKDTAMYPEVLISLGFKLVKEDANLKLPEMDLDLDGEIKNSLTHDHPDALYQHLQMALIEKQRVADNQKYGSMYAEVYKSLGFKKPRGRAKAFGKKEHNVGSSERRRRARAVAQPPPKMKVPPPIIDVSALADEIDSGRYPSKKRYHGDDHPDVCGICKQGGTLFCCDFCPNSVHMECILKRFTLKTPEPDEDFMCHKCIATILSRRKRAEGRRLLKQQREEKKREAEEPENPDIQKGMEYEHLASRGQDYSVLIELLQDARARLRQTLSTRRINDVRRRVLEYDSSSI